MNALLAIFRTEVRMQLRRPIFWIALVAFVAFSQIETFPSAANFHRLTHLTLSAYAAHRVFFTDMPMVLLVAGILAADRFSMDRRLRMNPLLWTAPRVSPIGYTLAKVLGSFSALAFIPVTLGAAGLAARLAVCPQACDPADFIRATLLMGLLPLACVTATAYALGALLDVRLAGVLLTTYVLWSTLAVSYDPVTGATQPYRLLGDLGALVFVVPGWPYRAELMASGWQTAAFNLGATLLALLATMAITQLRRREVNR